MTAALQWQHAGTRFVIPVNGGNGSLHSRTLQARSLSNRSRPEPVMAHTCMDMTHECKLRT